MRERKNVTWRHLKIGMEIKGYNNGNTFTFASGTVAAANAAFVTLIIFGKERRLNSEEYEFEVELTDEELHAKYREGAAQVVQNIQNKLNEDQAGYHEMWNSWLSYDPYEIAADCAKHNFKIIGHIELSVPKMAMFSGEMLEIGICCEYEDGERFWCHASRGYLERFEYRYPELQKEGVSHD